MQALFTPSLIDSFTFGPVRVLVDTSTGEPVAALDDKTGVAASFLYTRAQIDAARMQARNAFASTCDLY